MKYVLNIVKVIVFVLILSFLSGCSSGASIDHPATTDTAEETVNAGSVTKEDDVKYYIKQIDNYVQIKIPEDSLTKKTASEFTIYKATGTMFTSNVIQQTLIPDEKVTPQIVSDTVTTYQLEGGFLTVENPGCVTYATETFINRLYFVPDLGNATSKYYRGLFPASVNLSFASLPDAEKEIQDALNSMGLNDFGVKTAFSLCKDMFQSENAKLSGYTVMQAEKGIYKSIIPDEFRSLGGEYYYFIMREAVDGVEMLQYPHGSPDDDSYVMGTTLDVILSKNGIECLNAAGVYTLGSSTSSKKIIDVYDALDAIEQHYDQLINQTPTTITDVSLVYVPEIVDKTKNEYLLTPAWLFDVTKIVTPLGSDGPVEDDSFILIDAITGKEIL